MTNDDDKLQVVLCWHMHQPEYRDLRSGEYQLPWTYLHAIKDYVDMAGHLEAHPAARAVVNFAPILLDQLADYCSQLEDYEQHCQALRDPLLAALAEPTLPADAAGRLRLITQCLRANDRRIIERFPVFQRLATMGRALLKQPETLMYTSNQYFVDLVVWYHLGWLAETARRSDARIRRLQDQQHGYSLHERRQLLQIVRELIGSVIPRFRALAERGQVELAFSPEAHPILPLLLDFNAAREALPAAELPLVAAYPGGEERARWHLSQGLVTFERHFGLRPAGCWPSEGGLSDGTVRLLAEQGIRWCASGESVLRNSLSRQPPGRDAATRTCQHRAYRVGDVPVDCFFRDDGLSDLIGFRYADWHADDAVGNLLHHLEEIARSCTDRRNCVVTIILDGENAWEYYPENAYHFLHQLYEGLAAHATLELTTFSRFLARQPRPQTLPGLVAGSWVYGSFSTWIGDPDKNRGWDLLAEAKHHFDQVQASGRLDPEQLAAAERQLAACEGSDWFWWFGDYNPAASVMDFERLFRLHLSNLYQALGLEPPAYLAQQISQGSGAPAMGGVMRPGQSSGDDA